MRHVIAAMIFGVAAVAGWAGSAVALSCAFAVIGEEAPLTLVSVEVAGEPVADPGEYPATGTHYIRTSRPSGAELVFVTSDTGETLSLTFSQEGEQ